MSTRRAAVRRREAVAGLAVISLAFGIGVAACGGDEAKRLSAADYQARATKQCDILKGASEDLLSAQEPGATGATVARFMQRAADELRKFVAKLDDLTPPEALEADADDLRGALDRYAEGLDDLADRVGPNGTFQATLEANKVVVDRLNGIADDATTLVTRLELSGCLLPG